MKSNRYAVWVVLLLVVFICMHVLLVIHTDKKLIYKEVEIKYADSPMAKNTGIQKYITRGGTCITFETLNDLEFERRYIGIVQRLAGNTYYNHLIKERRKNIGLFIDRQNVSAKRIPFISLGRSDKKDMWYYADIYSFVKKKYSAIFLISYIIIFCLLFSVCLNLHLIARQKILWIVAAIVPVLYMLI